MSFDGLTLTAIYDELAPTLTGARLQRLAFAAELSLAVECFSTPGGRFNVLFTAEGDDARVQRIDKLPARGLERDTPFALLARKHLRDARVRAVRQPRLERVLELDCEQRDASGQHYRVLLIVEAMGRRSNLVLVSEDGTIMDAARRSPPSRNPRRPILPHLPYAPPPPQARLLPEDASADALAARAASSGSAPLLARFLSDTLAGLSPLAGRELAYRACGATDAPRAGADWPRIARVVQAFFELLTTHAWTPTVAFEAEAPLAFAPYRLEHLSGARLETYPTMSQALEAYYAASARPRPPARGDSLAAERRALQAPLEREADATRRRIAALEQQLAAGHTQREPLRRAGDLLLMHQASLALGSTELVVDGERVELDPHLSAVDNAQAYFARYRKAREAEERVPALVAEARQHAEYLAELVALVGVAEDMSAIRALRREVSAAVRAAPPAGAGKRQPQKTSAPFRRIALGYGFEALLGTSAEGNAHVTFDMAQPDDLWLHARGVPGAHVIVRSGAAEEVLERAAQLAAWHSAARASGRVEVDVAPRRYVRKIPNAPPGLVRYSNERTVRVTPAP